MIDEDDIFSSVPDEVLNRDDTADRQQILKFLKERQGQWFHAKEIGKECGISTKGTNIAVRFLITKLIEIDLEPIVSNSKGFSYATHPNMLIFYADALEQRKMGLERRIAKVREIYQIRNRFEVL